MDKRYRNFCFTQNNYKNTLLTDELACKYMLYGKEIGESGTPHLQGFVSFSCGRTLSAVIKSLPGCHVEIARNPQAAMEYCKKDGDFTERGVAPLTLSAAAKKGVAERWALAKEGRFEELPPENLQSYERIYKKYKPNPEPTGSLDHEWYYGDTGTGKSKKARDDNPDAYIKDPQDRWWDGYNGEDVVIIDDFDKYQVKQGGDLKRWLDHYPFQAPVKGGYQLIRPKKIIITSNYHPNEIWDDNQTLEPLLRRLHVLHFNKLQS